MDQNKIKRYLESLKNTNLNITNTNTIVTQNTLESNTVKLNNTVNLNTNNITYNGDSITLNITSNELKAYLMLDTLDNISNLEFVIPFITKPTSNTNITIYSLTNEILSSYTNDLSGKIHIYLTDIFKKQNAINIIVKTNGTAIFMDTTTIDIIYTVSSEIITPTNISIKTLPKNINYELGDLVDTTGLVLLVNSPNGEYEIANGYDYYPKIVSYNNTITISYKNLTTTYNINIDIKDDLSFDLKNQISLYNNDKLDFLFDLNDSNFIIKLNGFNNIFKLDLILENSTSLISELRIKTLFDRTLSSNLNYHFYNDEYNNIYTFDEMYYYISDNKKIYIEKNKCTLNSDGSIYYDDYEVKLEQVYQNLSIIPDTDNFSNSKYASNKNDEEKKLNDIIDNYKLSLIN